MNHVEALTVCEEFYADNPLSFAIGWEDTEVGNDFPRHRIIHTVVKLKDLSALGMRLFGLGWVPWEIEGVMSKANNGISLEPVTCITFGKPLVAHAKYLEI